MEISITIPIHSSYVLACLALACLATIFVVSYYLLSQFNPPVEPEKKPGVVVNAPEGAEKHVFPCFGDGTTFGAYVLYILTNCDVKESSIQFICSRFHLWKGLHKSESISSDELPEGVHDYKFLTAIISPADLHGIVLACRALFPEDPMKGYFKLQSFRYTEAIYSAALFLYTGECFKHQKLRTMMALQNHLKRIAEVVPNYSVHWDLRATPEMVFSSLVPYSKAKEAESKLRRTAKNDAANIIMEGDLRNQELKNQLKELKYIGRGMEHRQSMHFVLKVVIWAFAIMHLIFLNPIRTDIHLMGFVVCIMFLFVIPDCDTTKTRTIFALCLVTFVLLMGIYEDVVAFMNSDVEELCAGIDGKDRKCSPDEKAMYYLLIKCKNGMIGQFLVPLFGVKQYTGKAKSA